MSYPRPWGQTAPAYLTPAVTPPAGDPPPWWFNSWGDKQTIYDVLADGSWAVYPQAWFGINGDDAEMVNYGLQQSGFVRLGPFSNYQFATTVNLGIGQYVRGSGVAGVNGTIVNWVGAGDCFRQTAALAAPGMPGGYSSTTKGGGVHGLVVDGANHAAGVSSGFHLGDIESLDYDNNQVRHFNQAGDIGWWIDNHYNFTERLRGVLDAWDCTNHYVFDVTSNAAQPGIPANQSAASFARPNVVLKYTAANVSQNALVLRNGALVYDAVEFNLDGNHSSAASGTAGSVLTVTGVVPAGHPAAGQGSRIDVGRLDIGVETPTNTVTAQTITFGSSANQIADTFGVIDFDSLAGSPFTPSNAQAVGALFRHRGTCLGDPNLGSFDSGSGTVVRGAIATGQTIFVTFGSTISVNPAAAVTGIVLAPGGVAGGNPNMDATSVTIENLSANLLTFAAAATSNVAAGTSATVPAFAIREFKWNQAELLWIGGV